MGLYRKKPVVIEAVQFTRDMAIGSVPIPEGVRFCHRSWHPERDALYSHRHVIETLEGTMAVEIGDWVIKGVKGEFYPCRDDIFRETYEAASDAT